MTMSTTTPETVIISLPIDPAPTFEADVEIELPGSRDRAVLRFEFNHLTRDELEELDKAYLLAKPGAATDGDMISRIVKRWVVGPVDKEGRSIAYGRAALDRLLNAYPAAASAIYFKHQRELREARAKN